MPFFGIERYIVVNSENKKKIEIKRNFISTILLQGINNKMRDKI